MRAAISCLLLLLPAGALAGGYQDAQSVVEHIFDVADRDESGTLTPEEYAGAGLERYGVSFEDSDANADGEIALSEYLDLYERHHPSDDRVGL